MARPRATPADETPPDEPVGVEATVAAGGMAPLVVKVAEGVTINDETGAHRSEGDEFTTDGLTAVSLAQLGHVTVVGTGEYEIEDPEERALAQRLEGIDNEINELEARIADLKEAK